MSASDRKVDDTVRAWLFECLSNERAAVNELLVRHHEQFLAQISSDLKSKAFDSTFGAITLDDKVAAPSADVVPKERQV
jgi:hypothetical protein